MSLRKKKTHEIINAKRRRLINATAAQEEGGPEHVKSSYQGYKRFEAATEEYLTKMQELCPRFLHDQSLTPVSPTRTQLACRSNRRRCSSTSWLRCTSPRKTSSCWL